MKKRPEYIKEFIENCNDFLRFKKEKNYLSDTFLFMENYLIKKGYYEGFNFYKEGKNGLELSGSTVKENYDCIQLF